MTLRDVGYYLSAVMAALCFLWLLATIYRAGQADAVRNYRRASWAANLKLQPLAYWLAAGLFGAGLALSLGLVHWL